MREMVIYANRFNREVTVAQNVAVADYIARMKPEQGKIYFVTAESFAAAKNSPHLEVFRKKGVEVLLMYDRVDEWVMQHLTEFEKKPLQSDRKSTRLNSSHIPLSRMPSSA